MWLYYIYELATAPGVMVHELAHALFCLFARVRVHKIKLFQFGRTAGYVLHDEPQGFFQGMMISAGPLIINSLASLFLFSQFEIQPDNWRMWVILWLGLAIGLHAIPSDGDAKALFQLANHRVLRNPLVLIGYPFILLLYIFFLLKKLHIDWLYVVVLLWLGALYLKGHEVSYIFSLVSK